MIKVEKDQYSPIYNMYLTSESFFPLIAGVLLDKQDGVVYADNPQSPSQAYVEHAFGFAQIFGQSVESFEKQLEHYLLTSANFKPNKIRLYATYLPQFLTLPQHEMKRSYRQRFIIDSESSFDTHRIDSELQTKISISTAEPGNISKIDNEFGVVTRFWRDSLSFIKGSNAVVVLYEGNPASICYSASEADSRVEIDVLTLPAYRNTGLAKIAVVNFIKRCFNLSLTPLWDCFTNNSGSMMLCKSVGFTALNDPYPFYTIDK
ncbi:hypothetical protein B1207_04635 [Legionella quinlivanii]|uniref:N-acetyltransferase domain-containing protein n=1 Tax=Legionella quinlivanii TaxID=45073 RepID=A0A364LL59_9GAMM|nr:GNAT family N-acetyltransferase [Legionella quinlivanii]RAP37464.1 hypothetical protein B1207_04635 [Legionella quinlivanii]